MRGQHISGNWPTGHLLELLLPFVGQRLVVTVGIQPSTSGWATSNMPSGEAKKLANTMAPALLDELYGMAT